MKPELEANNGQRQPALAPVTCYADVGQPIPTVQTLCGPITQSIHELETRCNEVEQLCGQMLATLRVNRLRGTLTSADDKQLDEMIDAWSARFNRHNAIELSHGRRL